MNKKINIAVAGATGAVGKMICRVLEQRNFPVDKIYLLASERSAGKEMTFAGKSHKIINIADFDFSKTQIALFSAGASISEKYAPISAQAKCVVVDNTSQFRYDDDIPLVVPEVNASALVDWNKRYIIANPNCSTIQMVVALAPLHKAFTITRINVATYQAVSGSGQSAIDELLTQSRAILAEESVESKVYPKQIAFNALPHIDVFLENGYTKEEMKMVWETHKILDPSIKVNPTTVRIPVVYGHSEAVHIECAQEIDVDKARQILTDSPSVVVIDENRDGGYPTAVTEAQGCDDVFVGRIRKDISHPRGLNLWIVSDNLRKGAATNSVQIAEILLRDYIGK